MTVSDEEKLMNIIDRLTMEKVEIPLEEIELQASREGISDLKKSLDSLASQGLVMESQGHVSKIVKRLFW